MSNIIPKIRAFFFNIMHSLLPIVNSIKLPEKFSEKRIKSDPYVTPIIKLHKLESCLYGI